MNCAAWGRKVSAMCESGNDLLVRHIDLLGGAGGAAFASVYNTYLNSLTVQEALLRDVHPGSNSIQTVADGYVDTLVTELR